MDYRYITYGLSVLGMVCWIGCAQRATPPMAARMSAAPAASERATTDFRALASDGVKTGKQESAAARNNGQAPSGPELDAATGNLPTVPADRKIIYTAHLSIEVERFDTLPDEINRLVGQFGGYIANTSVQQLQGSRRSGSWTIRIPVDRYRDFLRSASGLGVPQSLREEASDVSEQFVDLEARIASSKKLESQIMQLLEKQTDQIDDLLAIERELARVRLEIEQMEGRLRLLAYQVAMSTVHLTANEKTTFIPPEKLSLSRRMAIEWSEAQGRAGRFFEDTAVFLIANTFVILAWVLVGCIVWFMFRAWRRRVR